jgi:hypothetical protein
MSRLSTALLLLAPLLTGDLASLRKSFRAEDDPAARIQLLGDMHALVAAGEAEPAAAAGAIAAGLTDDDLAVRAAAAATVAALDTEVALRELPRAIPRLARDWAELQDALADRYVDPGPDASLQDILESSRETLERTNAAAQRLIQFDLTEDAFREALAAIRDDRAIEGLAQLFEVHPVDGFATPICSALLAYGTANAAEPVVERFRATERELKERAKVRKAIERQKPRPKPEMYAEEIWIAREGERIETELHAFDEATARIAAWRETVRELLAAFAAEHGLEGELPAADARSSVWNKWWKGARAALPTDIAEADAPEPPGPDQNR